MNWKKLLSIGFASVLVVGLAVDDSNACTTVIVGKKATADGSTMVSHTCDGQYDPSFRVIPGGTFEKGTTMPVYKNVCQAGVYGRPDPVKAGDIPQVERTYDIFYAAYPFMNEKKLLIGEDTFTGRPEAQNSEALFMIEQLEVLCLQRAATARDCVKVMGEAAEKYGYADGGETLTIVDGNEGWVFEIMGPGPLWTKDSGTPGAVWAAQRVPDDHVFVSANRSRIGTINLKDTDNFMASANVISLAQEMSWYDPQKDGEFVFWKVYNPGLDFSPYNQRRREWRSFTMLIPSLADKLDPYLDPVNEQYQFSYPADKKLDVQDIMELYRDTYAGTQFDLTKGLAAGPFGNHVRYATPASVKPEFAKEHRLDWERAVSVQRCAYSFVGKSRSWMPDSVGAVVWFGLDTPYATVYTPFYSGVTETPRSVGYPNLKRFDRESAWWAFNFVSNFADLKYSYIIKDIQAEQKRFEGQFFAEQAAVEKTALELDKQNPAKARAYLTQYAGDTASNVVKRWWELGDELVYTYNDGYLNGKNVGYPTEWLEKVEFGKTQIAPSK